MVSVTDMVGSVASGVFIVVVSVLLVPFVSMIRVNDCPASGLVNALKVKFPLKVIV